MFWSMKWSNTKIGEYTLPTTVKSVMADTGTSLNMIPDTDFNTIMNEFFHKKNASCHVLANSLTACECTEAEHQAIPDITFEIDGSEYVIPRDMWYERGDKNQCVVKFMHAPGRSEWILGVNFFTNYYTVFDYESYKIGFAKSINFMKEGNQGKTFIKWALSGSTMLMNLAASVPAAVQSKVVAVAPVATHSKIILVWVFGLCWSLFFTYWYIMRTNAKKGLQKIKAVPVDDEYDYQELNIAI